MSAWMNESPNHNGNGFPLMNDPNNGSAPGANMMDTSGFMGSSPAQFNHQAQFPGQPPNLMGMPQQLPNPTMRNVSPSAFQNSQYQTNPVVPSKRPRPRDDSMAGSPRTNPGMIPPTRSETPQQQQQPHQSPSAHAQQLGGFPGGFNPQQGNPGQPGGNYPPHLAHGGSANATPSPMMSNQQLRPNVPQRVATASPHPFSPGPQQFNAQGSPAPGSDHGTPQPGNFMGGMPQQGFNPNFGAPSPSQPRPSPAPVPAVNPQMGQPGMFPPPGGIPQPGMQQRGSMDQQKMAAAYQMRLQQHIQTNGMSAAQAQAQVQAQAQSRQMAMQQSGTPNRPPQPRQGMIQTTPEQFLKNLQSFCQSRGFPLDTNPAIGGRPVSLLGLFQQVQQRGFFKQVTATNQWLHIAQMLQFGGIPNAAQILRMIYEKNLLKFEEAWVANQRKMQAQQQQHQQHQHQQQHQQQQQQQQPPHVAHGGPGTPTMAGKGLPQQHQGPPQPQAMGMPVSGQMGGPMPPHMAQHMGQPMPMQIPMQMSPQMMPGQHPGQPMMMPGGPAMTTPKKVVPPPAGPGGAAAAPLPNRGRPDLVQPVSTVPPGMVLAEETPDFLGGFSIGEYIPKAREICTWGVMNLPTMNTIGFDLERLAPVHPPLPEMGLIDIPSLTRSLECGLYSEVRVALDTLVAVSASMAEGHEILLPYCEDLVDALVDCGEAQLETLAKLSPQIADDTELPNYETLLRKVTADSWQVEIEPEFGTLEYDADRAVDRLIAVMSILRNLSASGPMGTPKETLYEANHAYLADEVVIALIANTVRHIGTSDNFLRSSGNTLDFFKDAVVLLSNISSTVLIQSRDHAAAILSLLLVFAPEPIEKEDSDNAVYFIPYDPLRHIYLPHAVDALAKLLARDEPNRQHFRALFSTDTHFPAPLEMLTKAFGMVIAPLPDYSRDGRQGMIAVAVESRKAFLMQGMLAAEVLVGMAPKGQVARLWINPRNGIAGTLLHLAQLTGSQWDLAARQGRKVDGGVEIVRGVLSLLGALIKQCQPEERVRDSSTEEDEESMPQEDVDAEGEVDEEVVGLIRQILPSRDMQVNMLSFAMPEWSMLGVTQAIGRLAALQI